MNRDYMRLLDLTSSIFHALVERLEQSGRLIREVAASGWAPFLERSDL